MMTVGCEKKIDSQRNREVSSGESDRLRDEASQSRRNLKLKQCFRLQRTSQSTRTFQQRRSAERFPLRNRFGKSREQSDEFQYGEYVNCPRVFASYVGRYVFHYCRSMSSLYQHSHFPSLCAITRKSSIPRALQAFKGQNQCLSETIPNSG